MPNETNTTNTNETYSCGICHQENFARGDMSIENTFEDFSGISVCVNCRDNTFRYSDRTESFIHQDDWCDDDHEDYSCEEEDRPEHSDYIDSYYSGSYRNHNALVKPYENFTKNTLILGIENEVQVRGSSRLGRDDLAYNITQHDLKNFAKCKEDSSIGYGFEIVSKPATFEYHKTAWDIFFQNSARYLRSYRDTSTGLHIHVNQSFFVSRMAVGKILEFINSDINKNFVNDVSGRVATHYCMRNNSLKIKNVKTYRERGAFHIYCDATKTHEFRCFSGNVKKESFFKTLEFVVAICHYAKNECPMININYNDFVSYVRSNHFNYPYLFNWLMKKGYLNKGKLKEKTKFYNKRKVRKLCV
jgi:hypothetical protein|tara:strand:- start:1418 stop:2497 length:1080 start_codon:yes stop_codon:yes gene_type:complete